MSISTSKEIASVSYNGTDIPLKSAEKETWVLNNSLDISSAAESIYIVDFLVPSKEDDVGVGKKLFLSGNTLSGDFTKKTEEGSISTTDTLYSNDAWRSQADRKFVFDQPTTGTLRTWLETNAVLQGDNLAIEPSKKVKITSDGTTTVNVEVPYDGIAQVKIDVDVAPSGLRAFGYPWPRFSTGTDNVVANWESMDIDMASASTTLTLDSNVEDYIFAFGTAGGYLQSAFYIDGRTFYYSNSYTPIPFRSTNGSYFHGATIAYDMANPKQIEFQVDDVKQTISSTVLSDCLFNPVVYYKLKSEIVNA